MYSTYLYNEEAFAIKNKLEYIANSFVRNKSDMKVLKKAVAEGHPTCKLVAKIE